MPMMFGRLLKLLLDVKGFHRVADGLYTGSGLIRVLLAFRA